MKHLIILTTTLFVFLASPAAFAKTEGNYLGADYIRSKLKFYEYKLDATHPVSTGVRYSNDHWGGGLNYKYAFSVAESLNCLGFKNTSPFLERFFIAPGLIYEANNVKARKTGGNRTDTELTVKNRYGAKLDIGYDVHDYFAPYFTVGYVGINYKTINYSGAADPSHTKTANVYDWFYGAGFKVDFTKDIALNFEYNREKFDAKTTTDGTRQFTAIYISRLEVFKMGVAYRF